MQECIQLTHNVFLPASPTCSYIGVLLGRTVGMGATLDTLDVVGVGTSNEEVLKTQTGSMMLAILLTIF